MNVWVLLQHAAHEGYILYGVYSTADAAEDARAKAQKNRIYAVTSELDEWVVIQVEVDAVARYYTWNDWEANRDE